MHVLICGRQHNLYHYQKLIDSLRRFLSVQRELGVVPPLFIMLSLLGVKGYTLEVNPSRAFAHDAYPIDRNDLVLPELLIEDFNGNAATVLRPAFDAIWNAAGWPQSIDYDKDGNWIGR